MRQLPERKKKMMRTLGKLSSAFVVSCLLCLALFSTGAFAQSASYGSANNVAQGVVTQSGWGNSWGSSWGHGCGSRCGHFGHFGRFEGFSRVTRIARETRLIRVT